MEGFCSDGKGICRDGKGVTSMGRLAKVWDGIRYRKRCFEVMELKSELWQRASSQGERCLGTNKGC